MKSFWLNVCLPVIALPLMLAATVVQARTSAAQSVFLPGNHSAVAAGPTSRLAPETQLEIQITFALRNHAELRQLLSALQDPASPHYHQWLTSDQFEARFARTPAEVREVKDWLTSQGFQVLQADAYGITSRSTVASAESSFATTIASSADGSVFAATTDPKIPLRFAGIIGSVLGLDNTLRVDPAGYQPGHTFRSIPSDSASFAFRRPPTALRATAPLPRATPAYTFGSGTGFAPADLQTFYDESPLLEANVTGAGVDCIALIENSDYLDAAVTDFDSTFGLPAFSPQRVLPAGTSPGINQDEPETLLDIEWTHAAAPGAAINVYIGNSQSKSLIDAIHRAVTDNTCSVISISYQLCGGLVSLYTNTIDAMFAQAVSQGQSVFVGSGDRGVDTCDEHVPSVNEMSADPNVVSVGGTQFTPNYDSSGNDLGFVPEAVWNDDAGASGGGKSALFAKPPYQLPPLTPDDSARDLPDVAFGAGLNSPGFLFMQDNGGSPDLAIVGGTSISTPTMAGFAKLIGQLSGGRLGNMNIPLYQLAAAGQAANGFRDVTIGDNSSDGVPGFSAGPGYDQASGWGSLDLNTFAGAFIGPWYTETWPMFRHDPRHGGRTPTNTSTNRGVVKWRRPVGGASGFLSAPAIDANGVIYVGYSSDVNGGGLIALNANGAIQWIAPIGVVGSSPAIGADGTIYAASDDGSLNALNPADGSENWSFTIGTAIHTSPTLAVDGTIYVGSDDGNLYAINPDGTQKWLFATGGAIDSSPAVGADRTIFVGSGDGGLYAINPDGSLKWDFATAGPIYSPPAMGADGTIYVGSQDSNLYAVNPSGTQKWAFATGGPEASSPAIGADGTIYVGSANRNLYAINPSGTQKWAFATNNDVVADPALASDGTIYVGSSDGNLYAITDTGISASQKWVYTPARPVSSPLAVGSDGTIYFSGADTYFYAVGPLATVPVTLKLTPKALKFSKTTVGSSSKAITVQLANPKSTKKHPGHPVLIEPIFTDSIEFAETNHCPETLPPGSSCTIAVTFTPNAISKQAGNLVVTDNANGGPQTVPLNGIGK